MAAGRFEPSQRPDKTEINPANLRFDVVLMATLCTPSTRRPVTRKRSRRSRPVVRQVLWIKAQERAQVEPHFVVSVVASVGDVASVGRVGVG